MYFLVQKKSPFFGYESLHSFQNTQHILRWQRVDKQDVLFKQTYQSLDQFEGRPVGESRQFSLGRTGMTTKELTLKSRVWGHTVLHSGPSWPVFILSNIKQTAQALQSACIHLNSVGELREKNYKPGFISQTELSYITQTGAWESIMRNCLFPLVVMPGDST